MPPLIESLETRQLLESDNFLDGIFGNNPADDLPPGCSSTMGGLNGAFQFLIPLPASIGVELLLYKAHEKLNLQWSSTQTVAAGLLTWVVTLAAFNTIAAAASATIIAVDTNINQAVTFKCADTDQLLDIFYYNFKVALFEGLVIDAAYVSGATLAIAGLLSIAVIRKPTCTACSFSSTTSSGGYTNV